jgi:cardiolipin synthase A/B
VTFAAPQGIESPTARPLEVGASLEPTGPSRGGTYLLPQRVVGLRDPAGSAPGWLRLTRFLAGAGMEQFFLGVLQGLADLWPYLLLALTLAVDLWASGHAVLHKRDTRAATAWVGLIWTAPLLGAGLYCLLGINRIRRRARSLRSRAPTILAPTASPSCSPEALASLLPPGQAHLCTLARLVGDVTQRPLLLGNRIVPLGGEIPAYPAMLRALDEATRSVALATYIFDNDRAGALFLGALQRAVRRGVEVRVQIDDVGARYSSPSIVRPLRRAGVPVALFLPRWVPWTVRYANLRNHRKILVVDGRCGFTGGMNIREGHDPELRPSHPIRDLHFRVEGPVVAHLQEAFAEDWAFSTGEVLQGERWFPPLEAAGAVAARGIADGPDEDFEKLRLTLLGALGCAQSSVLIVTPYFLPDDGLITALNVASLRGVAVDIVLPARNNLRLVQWASTALLWQVLERGCRVWLSPPPFDHSKFVVVDSTWALVGSANWDPRSLRLNFELNLECYDRALAGALEGMGLERIGRARRVTLEEVDGRGLAVKLRDGLARLLSPYL